MIHVERFPSYLEMLSLQTWCGGLGPRWAERRYSVIGREGSVGAIEAATLWVHIDMATMKPIPVPTDFSDQFAQATKGRKISARLHLPSSPSREPDRRGIWPLRAVDFDVLGHVNNSVYWAMVEEELARFDFSPASVRVTLEHHDAIEPGAAVVVSVCHEAQTGFDMWVTVGEQRLAGVVRVTLNQGN